METAILLGVALLTVLVLERFYTKFFGTRYITVVCNKTTDDGENVTLQFLMPEKATAEERLNLLNQNMEPLEGRMAFTVQRFNDKLDEERAKQVDAAKLKSV